MVNEIKCPDCGEEGSIRKVIRFNRKTGKRISFISDIVLGVLAMLTGLSILLVLAALLFFGKETSNGGDNSDPIALIVFFTLSVIIPTSIGICLINRAFSGKGSYTDLHNTPG